MTNFPVPYVTINADSWGPSTSKLNDLHPSQRTKFHLLPYAPFGRSDRLGRSADFISHFNSHNWRHQRQDRRKFSREGDNLDFQYKIQNDDFELVDTTKTSQNQARKYVPANNRNKERRYFNQKNYHMRGNKQQNPRQIGISGRGYGLQHVQKKGGRGGRVHNYQGGRGRSVWKDRVDRQASVSICADWVPIMDIDLNKMSKGISNTKKPDCEENLLCCGFLDRYNDAYDKCSTRTPATLKRLENKNFYSVTTSDDPVIEKLARDGIGTVFATDVILAHLMTCPRSVYPWDVIVTKISGSGAIFFDKRNSSQFDYLSVNETANIPPNKSDDDPDSINTPERLSVEATTINKNFSQQILRTKDKVNGSSLRKSFDIPNPFSHEECKDGMEPSSVAYRYRRFDLGENIQLVCRTELHGIIKKKNLGNEEQYMTAFSLNEHFEANNSSYSWRDKIDTQRGAVLANEVRNNAFKIAKWTARSLLAGADQMKIGFVSRVSPRNALEHQIIGTQSYRPRDFATQITLNEGGMWGIIRMLVNVFQGQSEGKYVLMRNPNKAQLRIFQVPPKSFEDKVIVTKEDDIVMNLTGGESILE